MIYKQNSLSEVSFIHPVHCYKANGSYKTHYICSHDPLQIQEDDDYEHSYIVTIKPANMKILSFKFYSQYLELQ